VEVETTLSTTTDVETTAPIQQALAQQDLLPDEQLVDTGYVDGPLLWQSQQQYGVRLLGPALPDSSWQARAGRGFDQAQFQVDWQQQQVTCPQGQRSVKWVSDLSLSGGLDALPHQWARTAAASPADL
jgi:transposase